MAWCCFRAQPVARGTRLGLVTGHYVSGEEDMAYIDMTAQLAPIIWGLQAVLALSTAAILASVLAGRLHDKPRARKVGLRADSALSSTPC